LHGAGSGRIYRTRDTATKIEGTASEKLTLGAPQVDGSTVGLWHLDETSGTGAYIKDATANANHGTPTGTSVVDGFYGKARKFNVNSDEINVNDSNSWYFATGNFTIDTWVKLGSTAAQSYWYWQYQDGNNHTVLFFDNNAGARFYIYQGGGFLLNFSEGSASGWDTTNWHHVALARSGNNWYIYRDGQLRNSTTSSITVPDWAAPLRIGYNAGGTLLDEYRISNVARSAEEIAEAYRAGRDHRVGRTISSTNLSSKTKLPFYVAADRPGTYLEATIGESAYANYEPDANTVGLWHLEEQTGSGAYIKDSSGYGNNGTPTGTTFVQGKIGKARSFNESTDYIQVADNNNLDLTTALTIDAWVKVNSLPPSGNPSIVTKAAASGARSYALILNSTGNFVLGLTSDGTTMTYLTSSTSLSAGVWYYLAATWDGSTAKLYLNGVEDKSGSFSGTLFNSTAPACIGDDCAGPFSDPLTGVIDEVRISNTARSADQIRQAYEIGRRTHPITIDFVSSPQAAYSSGTSITVNNPWGTSNLTDTLSAGDTLIIRENINGTEYISQQTVNSITNTSSTYGTVTLAAAFPTIPGGGYSTNAKLFKWQREYFDLTGIMRGLNHRSDSTNAANEAARITLRVTDGSQGATVWLDDFKTTQSYLGCSIYNSSAVSDCLSSPQAKIPSTAQRYFQYRIIFTTNDTQVSPDITSVTLYYTAAAAAEEFFPPGVGFSGGGFLLF
jgi:hypothetical protein